MTDDLYARAACRGKDPALWFPPNEAFFSGGNRDLAALAKGTHPTWAAGRAICLSCPVQVECLNFAIATKAAGGLWGGCTESERRAIAKRRRRGAA